MGGQQHRMHRVPLPRALLTILGYGALPYEKTSHSSTPKLQTSDLLENRCGGRGQVRRSSPASLDTLLGYSPLHTQSMPEGHPVPWAHWRTNFPLKLREVEGCA